MMHQHEAAMATDEDRALVEAFLGTSQVEPHAAQLLRDMPPSVQTLVMNKGSLQDARDQTAVLISRMNLATQAVSGNQNTPSVPMGNAKPGDWICPGCLDLQFARNANCRKCGTPNPKLLETDPEIDSYLIQYNIEDHAAMRFKGLDKETQKLIMARGSLDGARDATAVL